ncbi:undecaprenyl-diphosphate phosphatase [Helcococcus kunzii]|uniref:undecaprenyl-diphosphate phosphatase n=1 Tax=Helcococcus kunzii TaxID=40091 RepID=UPI0021A569BE|nr:undecaprenyl-diphosphate phosphatase [Helcococcus kunzii]MCT1797012.1 undecaprenyl-diphosphate phosphatase [Helcococcus kunzii]MCT1988431.1 undecaprenyl-diphosphate phosphatase [Helcococcus kunzii]
MLDIIKVIILSIIEGITEFLPVSSTGHMILANEFVNLEPKAFSDTFMVIIQLGAILAVIAIYFNRLSPFGKDKLDGGAYPQKVEQISGWTKFVNKLYYWFNHNETVELWKKVIVAVIPAAVLGVLFDDKIEGLLFFPIPVAIALIFYGIVIIFLEERNKSKANYKFTDVMQLSYKTALLIGLFQVLAMWPGTSRSAATIIGGMILGLNRKTAADFSFFLAIPTMLGATLLKVVKAGAMTGAQWGLIALGFVLSFIVAYVVIKKFLAYIQKNDFKVFGYYRIVLGILVLLYFLVF